MSIAFTSEAFPSSATAKDQAGLPWGCVLQPMDDIPARK
jgi:hypothetical protein